MLIYLQLDAYALVFPLLVVVLWVAVMNDDRKALLHKIFPSHSKSKDVDDLGGQVLINIAYAPASPTTSRAAPSCITTTTQSEILQQKILEPATLPTAQQLGRVMDYFPVSLLQLNLITCVFFVGLYTVRTAKEDSIPLVAHALTVFFYVLLACAAVGAFRMCPRNVGSSLLIFMLAVLRATEYLASIILPEGHELLTAQAILDTWGYFLTIYILTVLPSEYYREDKIKQRIECIEEAPLTTSPTDSTSSEDKPQHSPATVQNLCIGLVLVCCLAMSMLVVFPDWMQNAWVVVTFESCLWASLILGFAVTLLVIFKITPMVSRDSNGIRTRWVVILAVIGGTLLHLLFDVGVIINELSMQSYVPLAATKAFVSCGKETITQIIPLAFHFAHIIKKRQAKATNIRTNDAPATMRFILYACVLCLHLTAVGLLMEAAQAFALTCVRVAALLLSTNGFYVVFRFMPPLPQLLHLGGRKEVGV